VNSSVKRVEAASGVAMNFPELSGDLAYDIAKSAIDFALRVRSDHPNRDLGQADEFLGAGEWELAIDEIAAVIAADSHTSEFVVFAQERALGLIQRAQADSNNSKEPS